MMIHTTSAAKLLEMENLLKSIPSDLYVTPLEQFQGSSIGDHVRHALEFYVCLMNGLDRGEVCYDARNRDLALAVSTDHAIQVVWEIQSFILGRPGNKMVQLKANFTLEAHQSSYFATSLDRELAYTLDHLIHHLAIIKIGMGLLGIPEEMFKSIGIAPSTIRNQTACAQ